MRILFPREAEVVDLTAAYAPPADLRDDGPFVRCNMISTHDGAISLDGRSGTLGGAADRRVFQALRSWADVVLVGAGTVRIEGYGPARLDEDVQAVRRQRGQSPIPQIAIVTGSGDLDWSSSLFTDVDASALLVTTDQFDTKRIGSNARVAGVIRAGERRVNVRSAINQLHAAGHRSILIEGGPSLNADVILARLLDELCLTVSPFLIGGTGPRLFGTTELEPPVEISLVQLIQDDDYLLYRLAIDGHKDHERIPF